MVKVKEAESVQVKDISTVIKMMGDRVLILPSSEDGERSTRGGLVIPATAGDDRRLRWGNVLAIGPNIRHLAPGDRVLYAPDTGYEAEIQGETYLILRERDIPGMADSQSSSAPGMYL